MVAADGVEEWSIKRSGGGGRRRDGSSDDAGVDFFGAGGMRGNVQYCDHDFELPARGPSGRR